VVSAEAGTAAASAGAGTPAIPAKAVTASAAPAEPQILASKHVNSVSVGDTGHSCLMASDTVAATNLQHGHAGNTDMAEALDSARKPLTLES